MSPLQRKMWILAELSGVDMDIQEAAYHSPLCACAKCVKFHELFKEDN